MMLAQTIDAIPAGFWKNFSIAMLVLLGIAGTVAGIWATARKPEPTRINDEPAVKVEKVPKRYNHDLIDMRFGRIETRLDGHDAEFDAAWNELKQIREQNSERYMAIAVSLAEIKIHLGIRTDKNE